MYYKEKKDNIERHVLKILIFIGRLSREYVLVKKKQTNTSRNISWTEGNFSVNSMLRLREILRAIAKDRKIQEHSNVYSKYS